MATLPNLGLQDMPQGLIRFDQTETTNARILDQHYVGSSAQAIGIGHASKQIVSLHPGGTERVRLDNLRAIFEMLSTGLKLGTFSATPEEGLVRLSGTEIQAFLDSVWKTILVGGGAGTALIAIFSNASGSRDVYTVPAGKKAIVASPWWWPSTNSLNGHFVEVSGSPGASNRWCGTGHDADLLNMGHLLLAGEKINVDSAGNTVAFTCRVFEYDDTLFPELKQIRVTDLGSTMTTVHTVTAGKIAFIPSTLINRGPLELLGTRRWLAYNQSGSQSTLEWHLDAGSGDVKTEESIVPASGSEDALQQAFAFHYGPGDLIRARLTTANLVNIWGLIAEVNE